MKVTFGSVSLTGERRSGETSGLEVTTSVQADVITPIRSTNAHIFNRKNRLKNFSFTCAREHATPGAAESYALRHGDDVALKQGPLVFVSAAGGQTVAYPSAIIRSSSVRVTGATTFATYQVTAVLKNS